MRGPAARCEHHRDDDPQGRKTMTDRKIDTVQGLYEAFGRGDIDGSGPYFVMVTSPL